MREKKYIINVHERDWSIVLDEIYIKDKQYDLLSVGSDSDIGKFAHVREDESGVILFVYDVIWVSDTELEDVRFNETLSLRHKDKIFTGTLNNALKYIRKEMEWESLS